MLDRNVRISEIETRVAVLEGEEQRLSKRCEPYEQFERDKGLYQDGMISQYYDTNRFMYSELFELRTALAELQYGPD